MAHAVQAAAQDFVADRAIQPAPESRLEVLVDGVFHEHV
jgi:hypothetical protein